MNIGRFVGYLMIFTLVGIILFVVMRFLGQRDEFGYIWPDTDSVWYRYLMSWLNSRSSYLSWNKHDLSQTQQYFKRAIDQNRDTVLGNTLALNLSKVEERSQLETIQQCVHAVRTVGQTWDDIDQSYDELFALLQDQIQLMPTVLTSVKNLSTIKCIKNYWEHLKTTSITLVQISQSWWKQKKSYATTINEYPRILGNCETIMQIQAQSLKLKQDIDDMTYQYTQYRELLSDPARHTQLCQEQYTNSVAQTLQSIKLPTLQDIWDSVDWAIAKIKDSMIQSWSIKQ